MPEDIIIEPMTEEFLVWRCLHAGPLSRATIDLWPSAGKIPWKRYHKRNTPLLRKLTRTYGACAIIAHDNDRIVGKLRFYPNLFVIWRAPGVYVCNKITPLAPLKTLPKAALQLQTR